MSLFTARIPWEIPQDLRFEHQWIVTPQGGGKTTFIQHQLIDDIQRVASNEASVVVMDSQGDLINLVAGLKAIPAGQTTIYKSVGMAIAFVPSWIYAMTRLVRDLRRPTATNLSQGSA